MIQHGFRIIWNQKKKYGFILFELFAIFLVVFITMIYMIDKLTTYFEGTGCAIDHVYYMDVRAQESDIQNSREHFLKVRERLNDLEGVSVVSVNRIGAPYMGSSSSGLFYYGEQKEKAYKHYVDEHYPSVLRPEVIRGRWFTAKDHASLQIPVVINQRMADRLFGEEEPVGKVFKSRDLEFVVKGVIAKFKHDDYSRRAEHLFIDINHPKTPFHGADLLIRYRDGTHPQPGAYAGEVFSVMPPEDYRIMTSSRLEAMKKKANSNYSGDILFVSLIVGFLLFNLILGLIGILGYNVNRRWSEMGIRRAVGSTKASIRKLIFLEMFALTVMAIIPAFVVVVQIPAFEVMPLTWTLFIKAMLVSLALIFFLVFISVLYPGILASKIRPAVALKEE
jgi:putative ABC transport system permease protein